MKLLRLDQAYDIKRLRPWPANYRQHDLDFLAESLERGQHRTVVVREATGEVLAGNGVLHVALEKGWPSLAVSLIECDDAEAVELAISDNRSQARGKEDIGLLASLLQEVDERGRLEAVGYDKDYLNGLLDEINRPMVGEGDPDDVPAPPKEPITKPGDLWLLGNHRLLCGDCRDLSAVERLLDGRKANLVVTSPPYAEQRRADPNQPIAIPPERYGAWFAEVGSVVWAVLADDGSFFLNIKEHCEDGQRHLYVKKLIIQLREQGGWRFVDEFCWVDALNGFPGKFPNRFKDAWESVFHLAKAEGLKFRPETVRHESETAFRYDGAESNMVLTSHGYQDGKRVKGKGLALPSNVLTIAAGGGHGHSAAYPVALPAWFIRAFTDQGDVVLDPFVGAGTTIIAAHLEGRVGYGVEMSARYADVVCRRFQEQTNVQPILEATGEPHDFTAYEPVSTEEYGPALAPALEA